MPGLAVGVAAEDVPDDFCLAWIDLQGVVVFLANSPSLAASVRPSELNSRRPTAAECPETSAAIALSTKFHRPTPAE